MPCLEILLMQQVDLNQGSQEWVSYPLSQETPQIHTYKF